jgi:hypothetical protein
VTAVNGNKFETIEGNTNTGQGYGVWPSTRDTKTKGYDFIHLEDLDTIENNFLSLAASVEENLAEVGWGKLAGIIAVLGISGYFLHKNKKISL